MPIRILRDWTDSYTVNNLDLPSEVLFVRLIMAADDWGRFHADPRLVKGKACPLRPELTEEAISRSLTKLRDSGLIVLYQDHKGRPLLEIQNFGQRTRAEKSKFPDPPADLLSTTSAPTDPACGHSAVNCPQTADNSPSYVRQTTDNCPPRARARARRTPNNEYRNTNTEVEGGVGGDPKPPTVEEVIAFGEESGIPPDYCRHYHTKQEINRRWFVGPKGDRAVRCWRTELPDWWEEDRQDWLAGDPHGRASPSARAFVLKTQKDAAERELTDLKNREGPPPGLPWTNQQALERFRALKRIIRSCNQGLIELSPLTTQNAPGRSGGCRDPDPGEGAAQSGNQDQHPP